MINNRLWIHNSDSFFEDQDNFSALKDHSFSLQPAVWELGLYSGITAVNFPMSQLIQGCDNKKNTNNMVLQGKL